MRACLRSNRMGNSAFANCSTARFSSAFRTKTRKRSIRDELFACFIDAFMLGRQCSTPWHLFLCPSDGPDQQAIWLPAYCVLKDGVVTCSKDKRHTQVVDAFDMSETRCSRVASCSARLRCLVEAKRRTRATEPIMVTWNRVMKSDRSAKSIDFFVSTGSGEALVEFQVCHACFAGGQQGQGPAAVARRWQWGR